MRIRSCFMLCYLVAISTFLLPEICCSDTLMDKIEKTGKIRIGFQRDVTPFASFDEISGIYRGFSVDIAEELVFFLSKRFGKKIVLDPVILRADQRIHMILGEEIDIEMGASTQTYGRELQVDFSLVYSASETTFLVSRESGITSIDDLNQKKISAASGTTNLLWLQQLESANRLHPQKISTFPTHNLALWSLIEGKVDAYCADRILLATKRLQTPKAEEWVILEDSVGYEPYAFMIPEHNSDFRDFVNNTIRWTILTGKYFDIYEQWMGPLGVGPFKMSPSFKEYLSVITYPIPDNWWEQ